MKLRHVTVLGGAATGVQPLENIAQTAINLGLANDAAVYTLPQWVKNPLEVGRSIKEGRTITHSAGILAVEKDIAVPDLLVCNGPEQLIGKARLSRVALGMSAVRKMRTNKGFARDPDHEFGVEYREINRDNTREVRRHPFVHAKLLSAIQPFSTSTVLQERLTRGRDEGVHVTAAVTLTDEFWPHLDERDYGDVRLIVHEGNHDALLANPVPILAEWAKPPTE